MYPLSHDRYPSSMLLISNGSEFFAYFGDTGPDKVEQSRDLDTVWRALGPLVEQKKLKGMIIETSYPNGVEDKHLYGHLTPAAAEGAEEPDTVQRRRWLAERFAGGDQPHQAQPEAGRRHARRHCATAGAGQRSGREIYPDGAGRPADILTMKREENA